LTQAERKALPRPAALATALLFLMMAAHAALETARDALLLSSMSPVALLWSYILIAALAVATARLRRGRKPVALPLALGAGGVVSIGFWLSMPAILPFGAVAFYVFTAIYVTVIVPRFWLLLTGWFTVGEAKRYYTWIGIGGIAGAFAGSALSTWLLTLASARGLLLLGAMCYLLAAAVATLTRQQPTAAGAHASAHAQRQDRHGTRAYMRRLVWTALLASASFTVVDYLFKATAAATIPEAELASYFARTYTGVNLSALLVQLFVAPLLLQRLGTHALAMLLPMLLFGAASGFAILAWPALALAAKGADGALRNSVHRVTSELFYFPLSDHARDRWKGLADAIGQRGGQALGAVVLLAMIGLGAQPRIIAALAAALALAWMLVLVTMRSPYLALFRQGLRRGAVPAAVPVLASDTLQAVLEAFSSADDAVVCAAIDLLDGSGHERLVPSVLVHHPSQRVALRALHVLARSKRADLANVARPLLRHPDGSVRAAALRVCTQAKLDGDLLFHALSDPAPEVRSTAMLCLLDVPAQAERARTGIDEVIAGDDLDAKVALAHAIRADPRPRFASDLVRLLDTPFVAVQREVLRAMSLVPQQRYLELLRPLLADRRLLADVRRAILASSFGDSAVVERWLQDRSLPTAIRRHLPRTLSAFGTDRAATVLLRELANEPDEAVRYKILRGLGRMRANRPTLPLDESLLYRHAQEALDRAVTLLGYRQALGSNGAGRLERLLRALLQNKEERALERVFRILDVLHPQSALEDVWLSMRATDARVRDAALELIENVAPPAIRSRLLSMLQQTSAESRLRGADGDLTPAELAIQAMTHDESLQVRELAKALEGGR
jgi:AAA family ATP:ADP antiporter